MALEWLLVLLQFHSLQLGNSGWWKLENWTWLQNTWIFFLQIGWSDWWTFCKIWFATECDFSTRFYCVAAMSFAFGCSACAYSGDIINTLRWNLFQQWPQKPCSIAPNYSGTIFGLRNSAGHISGETKLQNPKSNLIFVIRDGCSTADMFIHFHPL